jgi:hypothetical protein
LRERKNKGKDGCPKRGSLSFFPFTQKTEKENIVSPKSDNIILQYPEPIDGLWYGNGG